MMRDHADSTHLAPLSPAARLVTERDRGPARRDRDPAQPGRASRLGLALLGSLWWIAGCAPTAGAPVDDGGASVVPAITACEDNDDCPDRAFCQAGQCKDAGAGCVQKSECAVAGEVCVAGQCGPPPERCASSEECPGSLLCDGFSRQCFDPEGGGCQSDGACALEPGCAAGCTCEADGSCLPVGGGITPTPGGGTGGGGANPAPSGAPIELGAYRIENREDTPVQHVGILPQGLRLEPGQHLVIARDASRADFEAYWNVSLPAGTMYLNAQVDGSGVPIVNGRERWVLLTPSGSIVDETGLTTARREQSYLRIAAASAPTSWQEQEMDAAIPGHTPLGTAGVGLVISQWSDAADFAYEFIELYYAP